jgi:DNA-directed RNA polymerase III subunit RPC1
MTLKTFHFAGVAGMSITQGVPRIKEIINASKIISTPVITCELHNKVDIRSAQVVKARIEKTYLMDVGDGAFRVIKVTALTFLLQVIDYIEDIWWADGCCLAMKVDNDAIENLQLDLKAEDIASAIISSKKLKISRSDVKINSNRYIRVFVRPETRGTTVSTGGIRSASKSVTGASAPVETTDLFLRVQQLKRILPLLIVRGYADASRAIIKTHEQTQENSVLVEGYGLAACMATEGVIGTATTTNSVLETREVLGIEAARATIVAEISAVMGDMDIDPRHMQLLADVMTYKGEVLGITRFGLAKMRDSVLQLASFEKTPDHLFEAAGRMKTDRIEGVSECIIMGRAIGIGTGSMKVVRRLGLKESGGIEGGGVGEKSTIFETCWMEKEQEREKMRKRGRVTKWGRPGI